MNITELVQDSLEQGHLGLLGHLGLVIRPVIQVIFCFGFLAVLLTLALFGWGQEKECSRSFSQKCWLWVPEVGTKSA